MQQSLRQTVQRPGRPSTGIEIVTWGKFASVMWLGLSNKLPVIQQPTQAAIELPPTAVHMQMKEFHPYQQLHCTQMHVQAGIGLLKSTVCCILET